MNLSAKAQKYYEQITGNETKLGDLRKMAKEIKKDHDLALELWSTEEFLCRQLAILVMDKKLLTSELIDKLIADMDVHDYQPRNHMADWLMANQLMKDKATIALMQTWEHSPLSIQRRIYWYYQARLRWTGQTPPDNTEYLLENIEKRITSELPEVQWAMNFTAAQIGLFDTQYRDRCIAIGENTGLYKDEKAPPNCTPNYLPAYIAIEAGKRGL